jgi:PIN domain nuclease of toxin-antitoxin system
MVVLDTCAIIETCKKAPRFSIKTSKLIEKGAYLLSISFAEIACKIKTGKLEFSVSPKTLYEEFSQIENAQMIDIGIDEWLNSINLHWPENKDPADRVITAFAISKNIPVVTSDKRIKHFYKKVIW